MQRSRPSTQTRYGSQGCPTVGQKGCPSPQKASQMQYGLLKKGIGGKTVDVILSTATDAYPWLREHNIFLSNKGVYMQWLEGEIAMKMFSAAVHYGIPMVNVHDAYAVNQKHSA